MTPFQKITIWVLYLVVIAAVLLPTVYDMRPDIWAYTKWGADASGLIFGYLAFIIGLQIASTSGGKMKKGLQWFAAGMGIMATSFFFGPIIQHYKIIKPDTVEAIHGIGMLGGMIGYLFAHHHFVNIIRSAGGEPRTGKSDTFRHLFVFVVFLLLFAPTMGATRTFGNNVKYWAELASFGLGGVMLAMAVRAFREIGGKYRRALNWLTFSMVVMSVSYPFGPIGQPNHFWTGTQGGTLHHGLMALSILLFLGTTLMFRRIEIYTPAASEQ